MKKIPIRSFLIFTLTLSFLLTLPAYPVSAGSKTLMINPVRVVFEGRTRTATVHVSNVNPEPVKYRVSLVTMRKNDSGSLVEVKEETDRDRLIKSMIRFSPKQATIESGKRQVVKIMVRKPADLSPGEYMTRIKFMPLADSKRPVPGSSATPPSSPKLAVDMLVGVTIPVVIQHGKVNVRVQPAGVGIQKIPQIPSGLAAVITLIREGDFSAFGDVIVNHISPAGSNKTMIGRGDSVGIYVPDSSRTFAVPLKFSNQVDFTSGMIRVEFHRQVPGMKTPEISFRDFKLK